MQEQIDIITQLVEQNKFKNALKLLEALVKERVPGKITAVKLQKAEWYEIQDYEDDFGETSESLLRKKKLAKQILRLAGRLEDLAAEARPVTKPAGEELNAGDLKRLVAQGKIKQVFTTLSGLDEIDQDLQNQIILLQSRWNALQKDINLGLIDGSSAGVRSNQITNAVLSLIGQLDDG